MTANQNRRTFLGSAAAFTIVPRHVLGGPGIVAPSDKIALAYIGTGTQGLREMITLLPCPEIRIVAVCDPNKEADGYRDWSRTGLLNSIRKVINKADWGSPDVIPGGRDAAKSIVDTYYAGQGCASYADFRELLAKEKDLDAVKIMTPDHLHGVIAVAAMKRGKHVIMHKPIANRLNEAKLVIDTARETKVATHFLPWDPNGSMEPVMAHIKDGAIGKLREIHNWTNRPVWPQYPTVPTDKPPIPAGFDWDLWLGPEAERPYHPNYTHMVFRGWYDFGGGSMADMGHYSLWTVFNALELESPTSVEPMLSHTCAIKDGVSGKVKNDYSFPYASSVRFRYPARGQRPAVDLIWHEGGLHPPVPEELDELPAEGMMFTGDKGKILAGFHVDSPRLLSDRTPAPKPAPRAQRDPGQLSPGMQQWIKACKGGAQSPGNFTNATAISEAVNLYAVALRTGRRLNLPDPSNRYFSREYRKGWDPRTI